MNNAELTSRWTFCWLHGDDHPVVRRLEKLGVWGMHAPGISYVEKTSVLRAILLEPQVWKLDRGTWYRQDIRKILPQIVGVEPPGKVCQKLNVLLWSRLPEVVESKERLRLVTPEEAIEEAARAWQWIGYVVRQPVRVQKIGGLAATYPQWVGENPKPRLPVSPSSTRSSRPRSSRRTRRTSEFD